MLDTDLFDLNERAKVSLGSFFCDQLKACEGRRRYTKTIEAFRAPFAIQLIRRAEVFTLFLHKANLELKKDKGFQPPL
jgi:hypothetical protein